MPRTGDVEHPSIGISNGIINTGMVTSRGIVVGRLRKPLASRWV
jgi:hypothetical protein